MTQTETPKPDSGVLFEGSDAEELHSVVSGHFGPHRLRVLAEHPVRGRYRADRRGAVSLYGLGYGADVEILPDELSEVYHVHWPLAGGGQAWIDGAETSGQFVVGPGQQFRMRWDASSYTAIVRIGRGDLESAARERAGGTLRQPLRFATQLLGGDPAVRQWIALVRSAAASAQLLARSPLAAAEADSMLINSLLDIQPHNATAAFETRSVAAARSIVLRRAVEYCHDHAAWPLSVADIAAAARVSVRSLHEAFRADLGTTPLGYVRRIRLEAAHAELLKIASGEAAGTVTDVALRWGFTHLSRFAQQYRAAYGRPPSATLAGYAGQ